MHLIPYVFLSIYRGFFYPNFSNFAISSSYFSWTSSCFCSALFLYYLTIFISSYWLLFNFTTFSIYCSKNLFLSFNDFISALYVFFNYSFSFFAFSNYFSMLYNFILFVWYYNYSCLLSNYLIWYCTIFLSSYSFSFSDSYLFPISPFLILSSFVLPLFFSFYDKTNAPPLSSLFNPEFSVIPRISVMHVSMNY